MIIGGLQKISLIDYPGKVSAVIFTQGCNFRCPYCHNKELVDFKEKITSIPVSYIMGFLKERKDFLDAVVISGGEPTLQSDLTHFTRNLKSMGLSVKLDTNGSCPKIIEDLVSHNLVNYIAMDIKGPLSTYSTIVRKPVTLDDIKHSIEIIMSSEIPYEFRSTLLPCFHSDNAVHEMGKLIKGAELFCIQQFNSKSMTLDPAYKNERSFSDEELKNLKGISAFYVKKAILR